MEREQMLERVVTVMLSEYIEEDLTPRAWDYMLAEKVLDAILPQITTVEELEALPPGTYLIGKALTGRPHFWRCDEIDYPDTFLRAFGPFTAWRP